MSISSLSKFTVPLASGQSSTTQGMLMPKLQYRFRILFENFGVSGSTTELTKQVGKAARPNVDFGIQTIDVYNSKINIAGKPSWKAISVTLRDDVTGAVAKLVGEQLQKQFDFMEQASAASGGNYKFTMAIEMLDGSNGANMSQGAGGTGVLERWECYGCYIQTANYNGLDYAQVGPQTIDLTIQPDNCIQTIVNAGNQRGTAATLSGTK